MSGIVTQNVGRHTGLVKAASGGGGEWTLIKTLTSDGSDATLDFVDGTDDVVIDSTYNAYCFKLHSIHPETDDSGNMLGFQGNAAGGSGFNETITSNTYANYNNEGGTDSALTYGTGQDQGQGTAYQPLSVTGPTGADNDQCVSGSLYLFNPSSTTFTKHFVATTNTSTHDNYSIQSYIAGYFNTASAIDEISFKFASDEIQGGSISLYGIG